MQIDLSFFSVCCSSSTIFPTAFLSFVAIFAAPLTNDIHVIGQLFGFIDKLSLPLSHTHTPSPFPPPPHTHTHKMHTCMHLYTQWPCASQPMQTGSEARPDRNAAFAHFKHDTQPGRTLAAAVKERSQQHKEMVVSIRVSRGGGVVVF